MNIYVYLEGEVKGPFEKSAIFAMLAEKQIGLQDVSDTSGTSGGK